MFSNNRKTIGVIVEAVYNNFPNQLCQGVIRVAREKGYNVAIFSAYGRYGDREDYYQGDCKIYDLPPYEKLDGVILLLDTIQDQNAIDYLLEQIRTRCHCPIVSIREEIAAANNLLIDNTTCMEKIIRHFIEDHHFTRLCFMTGPKDRWYARERLDCFFRIMEEYGLPVTEHQFFYGDFWSNMGPQACDWFLDNDEQPEAILCANDHMATAVASELIHRGYRIPQDICVSGYDGLKDTLHFSPSITTLSLPFIEMGEQAVEIIDQKQDTPLVVDNYLFDVKLELRESCGCLKISDQEVITSRRDYHEEMRQEHNSNVQFSFFSIQLSKSNTFYEVSEGISMFVENLSGYRDYCVCLCEDIENREDFSDYTDTMELRIGIRKESNLGSIHIPFHRTELLPSEMTSDFPQAWYFTPLHFGSKTFGYESIQFWNPETTGNIFFDWTTLICNKIQDILNQKKMQSLIAELQYMYNRDALTGLYNRHGLESHAREIFQTAKSRKKPVFFAIIDMDGMKQINDTYGHVAGDHALTTISNAIQCVCNSDITGARTGGDEFVLMAGNITEESGLNCLRSIQKTLDDFNTSGQKPYSIHASFGHVCRLATPNDSLETFMKESDEIMYKNKIKNKRHRNEPLR